MLLESASTCVDIERSIAPGEVSPSDRDDASIGHVEVPPQLLNRVVQVRQLHDLAFDRQITLSTGARVTALTH